MVKMVPNLTKDLNDRAWKNDKYGSPQGPMVPGAVPDEILSIIHHSF